MGLNSLSSLELDPSQAQTVCKILTGMGAMEHHSLPNLPKVKVYYQQLPHLAIGLFSLDSLVERSLGNALADSAQSTPQYLPHAEPPSPLPGPSQ